MKTFTILFALTNALDYRAAAGLHYKRRLQVSRFIPPTVQLGAEDVPDTLERKIANLPRQSSAPRWMSRRKDS